MNLREVDMPKLKVTMLTGRTINQGRVKEYGKLSGEYLESVAICEMDTDDMNTLGINENDSVKITTNYGSVVVRVTESARGPHPNIIFIPYGPWVNLIMDIRTHGTGMPSLKGLSAEVEPVPKEKVLDLPELLKQFYGKG